MRSATEEFGDPIVGNSDLRLELPRSMQILRLAQWPPARDPDPGTRRCRLAHSVREVTIDSRRSLGVAIRSCASQAKYRCQSARSTAPAVSIASIQRSR
jgi:hypothetical protein